MGTNNVPINFIVMRLVSSKHCLAFLVLLVSLAEAQTPSLYDSTIKPIFSPITPYPTYEQAQAFGLRGSVYMHVMIEAKMEVEILVGESGAVEEVKIASEEVTNLVGTHARHFSKEHFLGFWSLSVVPTLEKWQFPHVLEPCIYEKELTFELDDDA